MKRVLFLFAFLALAACGRPFKVQTAPGFVELEKQQDWQYGYRATSPEGVFTMACASSSSLFSLETAAVRESDLWSGPSWAAAILRCLAIDELFQFPGGAVDHSGGRGHRSRHAAREVLA